MAQKKQRKGFTFGNMTELQTRNAMSYIDLNTRTSGEIANIVSKYNGAPAVKPATISCLRGFMTKERTR